MEPTPDYSSYTRDQLADALAHINRERYPANYAALVQEIQKRAEQGEPTELGFESPPLPPGGIYGIFAAISTVGMGAFGLWIGFLGVFFVGLGILSFTGVVSFQMAAPFSCILGGILLLIAVPCLIPALFYFVHPKK